MRVADRVVVAALVLVAVVASCVVGYAQTWVVAPPRPDPTLWYARQNAVFMAVDAPSESGAYGYTDSYFAGWAFNCNGSQPEIIVWQFDPVSGIFPGIPGYKPYREAQVVTGLYRPDVAAAYAGLPCDLTTHSGWHVYFPGGMPTGVQAYFVQAYSAGGTWNPTTGEWRDASHHKPFFVIVR